MAAPETGPWAHVWRHQVQKRAEFDHHGLCAPPVSARGSRIACSSSWPKVRSGRTLRLIMKVTRLSEIPSARFSVELVILEIDCLPPEGEPATVGQPGQFLSPLASRPSLKNEK